MCNRTDGRRNIFSIYYRHKLRYSDTFVSSIQCLNMLLTVCGGGGEIKIIWELPSATARIRRRFFPPAYSAKPALAVDSVVKSSVTWAVVRWLVQATCPRFWVEPLLLNITNKPPSLPRASAVHLGYLEQGAMIITGICQTRRVAAWGILSGWCKLTSCHWEMYSGNLSQGKEMWRETQSVGCVNNPRLSPASNSNRSGCHPVSAM